MRLKQWMINNKITVSDLSEAINYQKQYMYKIIREEMKPGKKLAETIYKYTQGNVDMLSPDYDSQVQCECPTCGRVI